MTPNDSEIKRKRIQTLVMVAGCGAVCIAVAPFTFAILHGIFGILGAIVAYGVCYTGWMFAPVAGRMVANWRLKALKAEATRNPVETLQNEYVKKQEALGRYREQLLQFGSQVLSFADQVKEYQREGLEDAPVYVQQLQKMKQLQDIRKQKYTEAEQTLASFEETIQRTQRKWEMACAAAKMSEAAGELSGDAFDKICNETAMNSVQNALNKSFAELDMALLDNHPKVTVSSQKALPESNSEDVLDAQIMPDKIKVPRG